ncbi:MAG: hypothetical protein M3R50_03125 [Bacteroidota bacterium]|nr:hypothetical protein [Bacteroidota bacterium]
MLGFALIYFIGKYYDNLSVYHCKNKWGYAILGIVSYHAGALIFGVTLGIALGLINDSFDNINDFVMGLIAVPFGVGTTTLLLPLAQKELGEKQENRPGDD